MAESVREGERGRDGEEEEEEASAKFNRAMRMNSVDADADGTINPFANIRNIRWMPFHFAIFQDIIETNGLTKTHVRNKDNISKFAAQAMERMQYEKYRGVPTDTGKDTYEFIKYKVENKLRRLINDTPIPGTRKSRRIAREDPLSPKAMAVSTLHDVVRRNPPTAPFEDFARGSSTSILEPSARSSPTAPFEASESHAILQERPLLHANNLGGSVGMQSERSGHENNLGGVPADVIGQKVETNSIVGGSCDAETQGINLRTNQANDLQQMTPNQESFRDSNATTFQNHYEAGTLDTSLGTNLPQQMGQNHERLSASKSNLRSDYNAGADAQSGRYGLRSDYNAVPQDQNLRRNQGNGYDIGVQNGNFRMNQKSFEAQVNEEQRLPLPLRFAPKEKGPPLFNDSILNVHKANALPSQHRHPSSQPGYPSAPNISPRGYMPRDRFPGQSPPFGNSQRAEQHPGINPQHPNLPTSTPTYNDASISQQSSHINASNSNSPVLNSRREYTRVPQRTSTFGLGDPYTTTARPNHNQHHEQRHHAYVQDDLSSQSSSTIQGQHQGEGQIQPLPENDSFVNLPGAFNSFSTPTSNHHSNVQDEFVSQNRANPDFRDNRLSISSQDTQHRGRALSLRIPQPMSRLFDYDLTTLASISSGNLTVGDNQHQPRQGHIQMQDENTPEVMHKSHCKIAEENALAEFERLRGNLEVRVAQILERLQEGYRMADGVLKNARESRMLEL